MIRRLGRGLLTVALSLMILGFWVWDVHDALIVRKHKRECRT